MTLGRKDFSVTRTDGGADVFRLAGFLRDDDLIGHNGSFRRIDSAAARWKHIANKMASQAATEPRFESFRGALIVNHNHSRGTFERAIQVPACVSQICELAGDQFSSGREISPPPMIGKLLEHTRVQMMGRYAHLAVDPIKDATDLVTSNTAASLNQKA
jgi:hypothetical protein